MSFGGFAAAAPPDPAPPPLSAYGQLPALEDLRISPNGERLAYVVTTGDARRVVIQRTSDGKPISSLVVSKEKFRDLQWADDRHVLITVSTTSDVVGLLGPAREWFQLTSFNVETMKQKPIDTIFGEIFLRHIKDKTLVYYQGLHFENDRGMLAVYYSDLEDGDLHIAAAGALTTQDLFVNDIGQTVAESRYDQATSQWTLRVRTPAGWANSMVLNAPVDVPDIVGYGTDASILMVRTADSDEEKLHPVSLKDGKWGPALPDPFDELIFDDWTHALIGGSQLDGDTLRYTFFDPDADSAWRQIEKAYAGERVSLASWSANHRKVIVQIDGARDGYGYALVDLDAHRADWLGDIYPDIPVDTIVRPQSITYKAADGTEIPAYLTLPKGGPTKGLPLIVMPHGGPADRDRPDFDWLREAIVSRGYAVLQPNFRGSTGYAPALLAAGYGQWGRKMQSDLSDGVRYLAAAGTIDPKRVCIFGWSYGGYAALAGATLDKGVYRCAASMAGPSDLRLMLKRIRAVELSANTSTQRYWEKFMGVTGPNDPALDLISPAKLADKVEIPILLVHGKDDTVVPYEQSQVMADALRAAGKPVRFVTLKGEDHWGSRGETRAQLLTAVVDFLEANNPPR